MFGNNPVRKATHEDDGTRLWVQEIFYTIQGEGPYSGWPSVFIRLAGCNLRCWFCDTEFESAFQSVENNLPIKEIVTRLEPYTSWPRRPLIVLTGGEPLRQNCGQLVRLLIAAGFRVQVETAGTVMPPQFPLLHSGVDIVCSPKTGIVHRGMLYAGAWKYIIKAGCVDAGDGLPTCGTQQMNKAQRPARPRNRAPIYLSPMDEYDEEKNKANLEAARESCLKHGYRLTIQLHKEVGLP